MTIDQILQKALYAHKNGDLKKADELYRAILKIQPLHSNANHNLGVIALTMNNIDFAISFFKNAVETDPNIEHFWVSYINTLIKKNHLEEAELNSRKAIKLNPNFIIIHNIFANMLLKVERSVEAVKIFGQVVKININSAESHNNLGVALQALRRENEAEASFGRAIQLNPKFADAHYNLGLVLKKKGKIDEAGESYDRAKKINPDINYLLGTALHSKMYNCEWEDLSDNIHELKTKIDSNMKVSTPFPLHSMIDDPYIHRKVSEIYSYDRFSRSNFFPKISYYRGHKKIKIGYFSPNFNNHPVSFLTAKLYEIHDREKFEIHAFSFSIDTNDEFNIRVKNAVDHYHDVSTLSDQEIIKLARSLEIDIAIDLAGHTDGGRTNIFSMSAAPIQIGYIGFLGTMGSNYYDYVVADKIIIPEKNKKYYTENIIYLPNYQVNDSQDYSEDMIFNKHDFGIPDETFVFCCFNQSYKFNPNIFDRWAKILKQVEDSVLMLYSENKNVIKNLKIEISNRGINPNRLIFLEKLIRSKYLARYKITDLFLDTHPYNAGATASDALRMGVPVLTYQGKSYPSRMGSSLLSTLNLPELIATSEKDYEIIAIELGKDSKKFDIIKEKLTNNLKTTQLFNTYLFSKNLEKAYQIIYKRSQDGLDSEDIEIKS
tara:strand:+ start:1701 stop:3677 length:1977 start_codon:yes stop_codon:yes gene_type:complete